jgi:RNA polymerase sigma factor (TIGR02999 family)
MKDVTRILNAIEGGDPKAADELLPLVYEELRFLAARKLSQEKPGQTLQATALVHEAYLRLVEGEENQNWNSRGHFFKAAAEAMRRMLVENARKKKSMKRGGDKKRVVFEESLLVATHEIHMDDLLALDEALEKLSEQDETAAELIKLRVFAGLAVDQASEVLQVSLSKAYTDLEYARAWLRIAISGNRKKTES